MKFSCSNFTFNFSRDDDGRFSIVAVCSSGRFSCDSLFDDGQEVGCSTELFIGGCLLTVSDSVWSQKVLHFESAIEASQNQYNCSVVE